MRTVFLGLLILAFTSSPAANGSDKDKPVKSTAPLSTDEIAIYRAVLQQYSSGNSGSLNVSARTYPQDPTSPMNGLSDNECLQGIRLENLAQTSHSFHDLTSEVLASKNMKLVDPNRQGKVAYANDPSKTIRGGNSVHGAVKEAFATALFSMSEIAFDKEHHNAVVSYSFWCGSLCGNGATLVFERVGDQWKNINRNCGGWVS